MRTDETRVTEYGERGRCKICNRFLKKKAVVYEWPGGSSTEVRWECTKIKGNDMDGYEHE